MKTLLKKLKTILTNYRSKLVNKGVYMTVTRQEYEKMKPFFIGDFWNKYKLCSFAFNKYPDAQEISYSIETGLCVDFNYRIKNNEIKHGQIFDSENYW